MKKVVTLILVLMLCLVLCACGKSEAVIQAETLISVVGEVTLDSESAIAAAESAYHALSEKEQAQVENYATLTEARSTFDTMLVEEMEKRAFYYGEWKDVIFGDVQNLQADNYGADWQLADQGVKIGKRVYTFEDHGDFVRLVSENEHGKSILVPPEYLTTTEVEITMENWSEYLQPLRQEAFLITDQFDDIVRYEIWILAALRDEIVQRFDRTAGKQYKVSFDLVGTNFYGDIAVNEETKEFALRGELAEGGEVTQICDFWQRDFAEYHHSYIGDTEVSRGWQPMNVVLVAEVSEDAPGEWDLWSYLPEYTMASMQGTLLLYDLPVCK